MVANYFNFINSVRVQQNSVLITAEVPSCFMQNMTEFFDFFRTSHVVAKVDQHDIVSYSVLKLMFTKTVAGNTTAYFKVS